MQILIAPNAFKHSLTADQAAMAIQTGLQNSALTCTCQCFPVGDGGDGTAQLLIMHSEGETVTARVHDPLSRPIDTMFGLIDNGKTAVIEMADASGIRLLRKEELNPLRTTSYGTGELIKQALDKGVKKIIIGMGGSATVDGSTGILKALGLRFNDAAGQELNNLPESLVNLAEIDSTNLDPRLSSCEIVILCDVDNYLLGKDGAAAIFGPQKGADAAGVEKLDAALAQFSKIVLQTTGKDIAALKHSGTAGGAAAGLYAFANVQLVPGAEYFLKLTGFEQALQNARMVITGEGSLDEQTLQGKAPFAVAAAAKKAGVPVIGMAGRVPLTPNSSLNEYFNVLMAIGHQPADMPEAIQHTEVNLIRTATAVGNLLAASQS